MQYLLTKKIHLTRQRPMYSAYMWDMQYEVCDISVFICEIWEIFGVPFVRYVIFGEFLWDMWVLLWDNWIQLSQGIPKISKGSPYISKKSSLAKKSAKPNLGPNLRIQSWRYVTIDLVLISGTRYLLMMTQITESLLFLVTLPTMHCAESAGLKGSVTK